MIIYKTTNLINDKIYIGFDSKNNDNYFGGGTLIKRAIKKYGKENFIKETLEICDTKKQLCYREIYWIAELNSQYPIGYNLTAGGDVGNNIPRSESTRKKISESQKRRMNDPNFINSCIGKKRPDQSIRMKKYNPMFDEKIRKNHSELMSGENHHFYGKKRPDFSGDNNPKYWKGKKRPDMVGDKNPAKRLDVRKKISESKLGDKNPAKRPDVRKKLVEAWKRRKQKNA